MKHKLRKYKTTLRHFIAKWYYKKYYPRLPHTVIVNPIVNREFTPVQSKYKSYYLRKQYIKDADNIENELDRLKYITNNKFYKCKINYIRTMIIKLENKIKLLDNIIIDPIETLFISVISFVCKTIPTFDIDVIYKQCLIKRLVSNRWKSCGAYFIYTTNIKRKFTLEWNSTFILQDIKSTNYITMVSVIICGYNAK